MAFHPDLIDSKYPRSPALLICHFPSCFFSVAVFIHPTSVLVPVAVFVSWSKSSLHVFILDAAMYQRWTITQGTTMIVDLHESLERRLRKRKDASDSTAASLENESTEPTGRTTMALWVRAFSFVHYTHIITSATLMKLLVYTSLKVAYPNALISAVMTRCWAVLRIVCG